MLDKLYNKRILNIVLLSLLGLAALSVILWLVLGDDIGASLMLWVAYIYMALTIVITIGMTAMNFNKGRGDSKLGLYVFGSVAVLAVIFYFAGSAKPVIGADGTVFDGRGTLKMTDMMLYLAYVAMGVVVGALLAGEIWSAVKNSRLTK